MNPQEQYYLREILSELAATGTSKTYDEIWLNDYKEIPVDINTFIESEFYLGATNDRGKRVFPYWRNVFNDIFAEQNKYEECFFTGATRIGKTSSAITVGLYMLYWLQCLRDPQRYFHKKDISIFSVLFFNITKEMAAGVAFREFNDTIKGSPWFNQHGTFSKSDRNFYYIPEGGKISIEYGSDASHGLGKQVFCVTGDTQILTSDGPKSIASLENTITNLGQYESSGNIIYKPGFVCKTKYVTETVKIELEDGSVFEGTPDHLVMLSDGTYKALGELENSDDVKTFNI